MSFNDSEAIVTIGKILSYSPTSNGTFVTVFGTTDITPPEREIGKAEYTNDNSPNRTKQYKPALTEPGTVKATYKYQSTQFATIETVFAAAAVAFKLPVTPPDVPPTVSSCEKPLTLLMMFENTKAPPEL